MLFHYIAFQTDGKVVEAEIEAANLAAVLDFLKDHNLKPISVKQASRGGKRIKILGRDRITATDQVFLSKYLTLMLKGGMSLFDAINVLIDDFSKRAMKEFLLEIKAGLEKGQPFYTTFARHPGVFSPVYINLVRAGETAGNLEKVFDDLSETLTKQKELKDRTRSALIYPIVLMVAAILIVSFLVVFALPKIADVFSQSGFNPPLFSKIVFGIGLFLKVHGLWFLIGFALLAALLFYLSRHSIAFKEWLNKVVASLPGFKNLVKKLALQRFASTLSSLIRAGIPLNESLEIVAQAVGNIELQKALMRISQEGLNRGLTIDEAFRREPFFPKSVVSLIAVSEKGGHLEEILSTLADFYTKEIDSSLKALVSLLEPILLLGIGVIIGLIALAVLIPIYQLTTQF